jgi:hypothetical protein
VVTGLFVKVQEELAGQWLDLYFWKEVESVQQAANDHTMFKKPSVIRSTSIFEVNLRPTVSRRVCPGIRRPSGTCDQFFFRFEISFRQLQRCYFVAPSLTRGRVCNLLVQLLLGLARAVTLW